MSDHMNMESSSVLKNSETGQGLSARQTSPMQESEFGSRSLASEATEEKHVISTDENNGSTEARAMVCKYNGPEQFRPLPDDLNRNSSCEQAAKEPEDAIVNSNSELLHLLPEDAARKNLSVERDMPELNHELVPEGVNSEELVEKQKFGTENIQNGPAETGTLELNCPKKLHLIPEDAARKNLSADQDMPELNHELVPESVDSEELVEKQNFGTENIQNGPAETWMIELDQPEKLHLLPEDASRENLSADQDQDTSDLNHELVPESVNSEELAEKQSFGSETIQKGPAETWMIELVHSEKLHLLPEDAERKNFSDRDMSELNSERIPESVNNEEFVGKQNFGTVNIQKGPAETGTIEPDHLDKFHLLPEYAERKNCSDRDMSELNYELVPEGVDGEELVGKQNFGTVNIQNGPAETRTIELHCPEQLHLLPEDAARNNLSADRDMSELNHELVPESVSSEALAEKQEFGAENVQNKTAGEIEFNCLGLVQSGLPSEGVSTNSSLEQLRPLAEEERESSLEPLKLSPDSDAVNTGLEQLRPLPDNAANYCDFKQLEPSPEDSAKIPRKSEGRGRKTSAKSTKRKYASSVDSTRVLRSRSQEKPKALEPSNNLTEHGDGAKGEKRRKNRKKKQVKTIPVDEFSRIRMHLRYFLNRMNYEHNLIDAYSGEGWKGQSLDKIKPVKELQRAKSEILRRKLRIRDLFRRLDLSIAEGRLPESLFDSEGEIDSEDIFCAKCGSKDLPADNDIVLCDGACERGFHQFCLNPPLLKEDIPPDDEGWLCPGCDCKVDCIELLNDSQGTTLSILDTWEKVFPEAAAAAGNKLDDSFGLPSDDSEDTDYNPDSSGAEKVEGDDESSSDDSDFYSSEDFGTTPKNVQSLELPSDDSEDDDFDPDAPDLYEPVKQESSSSDFTSDSDDFSAVLNENTSPSKDEPVLDETMPAPSDHTKPCRGPDGERSKVGQRKIQSLNDELLSLLESAPCQGESTPPSGRRHIERLDYKKLYEETYGNDTSDSSDQDWKDVTDAPEKTRKKNAEKFVSGSPSGRTPIIKGTNNKDMKHYQEEIKCTSKRTRKKLDAEGTNNSPAKSHKGSSEPGSSCSGTKRSPYKRLGETVTRELLKSFNENQYPERATKEKLAKELGITVYQISKWFENVRFHSRHSSRLPESVPSKGNVPQMKNKERSNSVTEGSSRKGSKTPRRRRQGSTPKSSRQRSVKPRGRKRKSQLDHQAPYDNSGVSSVERTRKPSASRRKRKVQLDHQAPEDNSHILGVEETQKLNAAPLDLPKAQEARKRGRPESSKPATPKGPKRRKLDHQAPEHGFSIEQKQKKRSAPVDMPKAQEARKRGRPKARKSAA